MACPERRFNAERRCRTRKRPTGCVTLAAALDAAAEFLVSAFAPLDAERAADIDESGARALALSAQGA